MTEEWKVVLRRSEHSGFGFSLLGTTGPHVIYDIVENSPAADCGEVEAGDVILKVNGTDVHRYTTKEVLKCLRLSDDLVTLELKRDPKLKARIKEQLAKTNSPHYVELESHNIYDYSSRSSTKNSPIATHQHQQQQQQQHSRQQQQQQQYTSYESSSTTSKATAPSSPAQRYKSPSHLPSLRQSSTIGSSPMLGVAAPGTSTSSNHSRNSSASSAKIQFVETAVIATSTTTTRTEIITASGTGGGTTSPATATSPTSFRPSRIPQALKCAPKAPGQNSPQHKRSRPSQIPKLGLTSPASSAAPSASNGNASSSALGGGAGGGGIQHSNSFSSSATQHHQHQRQHQNQHQEHHHRDRDIHSDSDPNSAPPQPAKAPRFEAYMMTGDLILNLSRTPQSSNLLPALAKKVDSLRDSPNRSPTSRANGALAPRASGESSPTSSSSVDSPMNTASSDSMKQSKSRLNDKQHLHNQSLQQQQRDSVNNTYNRKDSLTNDTLLLCEEIERDEDIEEDIKIEEEEDGDGDEMIDDNNQRRRRQQHQQQQQQQKQQRQYKQQKQHQQKQKYRLQVQQSYEYYQNDDDDDEDNEEDHTHYDITNIETYNSGGHISSARDEDDSVRQCLVIRDDDDDDGDYDAGVDEDYSTNSVVSASAKQRLRVLKQKSAASSRHRNRNDVVDSALLHRHHHHHYSASSTSSVTVKSDGGGGICAGGGTNTSLDETSFSVPTSPISLSTPLIDKETANSVPTSPEPSSLGAAAAGQDATSAAAAGVVVRRHNGHVVRKCDAAGFRTSKSEDHLQQIQREGIAAVIPIDIDEDVNSSLNTLLDTRHDSEDSQPTTAATATTRRSTTTRTATTPPSSSSSNSTSSSAETETATSIILYNSKNINNNNNNNNNKNSNNSINNSNVVQQNHHHHHQQQQQLKNPNSNHNNNINYNKKANQQLMSNDDDGDDLMMKCCDIVNKDKDIVIPRISMMAKDVDEKSTTTTATSESSSSLMDVNTTTIEASILTRNLNNMRPIFRKKTSNRDRIVWTYNAPLQPHQLQQQQQQQQQYSASHFSRQQSQSNPNSHSSSISSSPQHSAGSPASPTSVSSSVMSSSGSKGAMGIGAGSPQSNGSQLTQQQQADEGNNEIGMMSMQPNITGLLQCPQNGGNGSSGCGGGGGDHSVSEAISNISSPDYQDEDNLLSSRDLLGGMVLSDPSDSDSTILVSDTAALQRQQMKQQLKAAQQQQQQQQQHGQPSSEHKLVIQVRGIDSNSTSPRSAYSELKDSEDELATLTEDQQLTTVLATTTTTPPTTPMGMGETRDSSPPVSDDGSDVESLHSYHYSPKAVDMPSAIRLAKRLYSLDGFKKSDVSRHLSKNNDFSRAVADEYLKYFNFEKKSLDQSLREFLQQFALSGETQERERVLVHFSKRFLDCNQGAFNSQDAVHTLTCAIMLLNTDLHGQNISRKMSCAEFIENLAELNDGENFPKDVLKYLYQAIKSKPLEWALDDDATELQKRSETTGGGNTTPGSVGSNPFLDLPESSTAVEYKKGYVMRKCCYDSNFKKTPFGKRSWKMFYCTLRDLVLYLHKDEHGFRKSQMSDNLHNAIRIHHALATKATDYTKKQHVFRLQTADQAEYLFQTSDSKELQSWVETINFVCAAYSAPPLEGGVGSQKRFQRPLLPSAHTKLLMKEQMDSHELQLGQLENELSEHKKGAMPSKGLPLQNFKEKENYLQYELRRYKTYVSILSAKLLADQQQQLELQQQQQQQQQQQLLTNEEESDTFPVGVGAVVGGTVRLQQQQQQLSQTTNSITTAQQQQQQQISSNRYSNRAANYRAADGGNSAGGANSAHHQQQQDIG